MKNDRKNLTAAIETLAALISQHVPTNSAAYRQLHELRDMIQIYRADSGDYHDMAFGVCEDILTNAIQNVNADAASMKRFG